MYKDRTDYAGGQAELADITLQYDTGWQQDVDALETRVKSYKAEKDAAEEAERQRIAAENAAKREQRLKDQYSGKLPVDGMPVSCLKYTSLGSPTKTEKCQFYDSMDVHRRYKILHWYNSEGQTVAYCHSHQPKGEYTEVIYAFTYYETPSVVRTLPRLGRRRVHRVAAIPEASWMTTTIQKTSGKITKIGMRTRMKRGMSGRTDNRPWIVRRGRAILDSL